MSGIIEGKHLDKWMMLPPRDGTCQECAVEHPPDHAHNAQSLFYQYKFYNDNGRWPNWNDAFAPCAPEMQDHWRRNLAAAGVDVEAGDIHPRKDRKP